MGALMIVSNELLVLENVNMPCPLLRPDDFLEDTLSCKLEKTSAKRRLKSTLNK
jgi:hypothetical protein